MKAEIKFINDSGFVTSLNGESDKPVELAKALKDFIDQMLDTKPAFKIVISNLNKEYISSNGASFKIPAIRAVRAVTGLGLPEAKAIVDCLEKFGGALSVLPVTFTKEEATRAVSTLNPLFDTNIVPA